MAPLKPAVCTFFTPFFTVVYIVEQLILQSSLYCKVAYIAKCLSFHDYFSSNLFTKNAIGEGVAIAVYTAEQFVLQETFLSIRSVVYNQERFQIMSGL